MRCFRSGLVVVALSCAVAPPGLAQSGEARSMASMQQLSGKLARSYLQTWSSNTTAALDQVPRLYASRTPFTASCSIIEGSCARKQGSSSDGPFGTMRIGRGRCGSPVMSVRHGAWFAP
jgi:hypothetical protein